MGQAITSSSEAELPEEPRGLTGFTGNSIEPEELSEALLPSVPAGSPGTEEPQSTAAQLDSVLEEESLPERKFQKLDVYEFRMAGVKIRVEPRLKQEWEEFLKVARPGWVAFDGRVNGRTRFSKDGLNGNINHDELIPRDILGASCKQSLMASDNGRFRVIRGTTARLNALASMYAAQAEGEGGSDSSVLLNGNDGELELVLCVEDIDEDVVWSLAAVLFTEKYKDNKHALARLRVGVEYASVLDSNKGSLPVDFVNSHELEDVLTMLKVTTFVGEPYRNVRKKLHDLDARGMSMPLNDMLSRVEQYISAENDKEQIWSDFRIPSSYVPINEKFADLRVLPKGWTFSSEEQQAARLKLALKGVQRLVSLREIRSGDDEGRIDVSLTAFGADAAFELPDLCIWLNRLEAAYATRQNKSGNPTGGVSLRRGNNWDTHGVTAGGSPKKSGTALPVELLIIGINTWIEWRDAVSIGDEEHAVPLGPNDVSGVFEQYDELGEHQGPAEVKGKKAKATPAKTATKKRSTSKPKMKRKSSKTAKKKKKG